MPWPERIDAELPAPVPEEPETLREEIIDELSDHYRSAMDREHRFDEVEARRRVLDRFGDPVQVARQLWFDAMKGKVMSQRITLITSCVMAAACLAAVALAWTAVTESRQLNTAILDKLTALANRQSEHPQSLEWMPVKVRLVTEKDGGPPAEGFVVTLMGNLLGETGNFSAKTLQRTTGPDGLADFGLVRIGQHALSIGTPWSERHSRKATVRPGSEDVLHIVCPQTPPAEAAVTIRMANPLDNLENVNFWVMCDFKYLGRRVQDVQWGEHDWRPDTVAVTNLGLIDLQGEMRLNMYSSVEGEYDEFVIKSPTLVPRATVHWPIGDYRLTRIRIADRPRDLKKALKEPLRLLGDDEYRLRSLTGPTFSAKPGHPNNWQITLREQLIDQVHRQLQSRAARESEEVE